MMDASAPEDRIALPQHMADSAMTLHQAIEQRRSLRSFARTPLALAQLARVLHSTYGITDRDGGLRAAPSAGALYPLEIYVVAHHVEQLPKGIYHYLPSDNALVPRESGDFREQLKAKSVGQGTAADAAVVLAFSAVFHRTRRKYGERANRYILLDIGHAAQNTYLSATALGLAPCALGAFLDDEINRLFRVDGAAEAVLYMMAVGTV